MRLRCELPATTARTPGVASSAASAWSRPAGGGAQLGAQPAQLAAFQRAARAAAAVGGVEHERAHRAGVERVVEPVCAVGGVQRGGRALAPGEPVDQLVGPEVAAPRVRRDAEAAAGRAGGEQRVDDARGVDSLVRAQAGIEAGDHPRAGRERVDPVGRRRLSLHQHVVVAECGVPRGVQTGGAERALGVGEQARVARGVEVGTVEQRVRVVGGLDAVISGRSGVGVDLAAVEHG
jgi:plasmid stabilization system protein ParE